MTPGFHHEAVFYSEPEEYLAAPDADGGGRGLWIVNHLCDLVQLRSSRAGSVVRLHMSV